MIQRSALPKGVITKVIGDTKLVRTLAGHLKTQEVLPMRDLRLPKFDKNRRINQQKVLVFDNDNVKYNIILGTNFHSKTGIKLNYSEGNMEWFDCSIPLCPPGGLDSKEFNAMEDMDSNALQTLLKQLWKLYCQTSMMLTFTLMMLVLSPMIETTMSIC